MLLCFTVHEASPYFTKKVDQGLTKLQNGEEKMGEWIKSEYKGLRYREHKELTRGAGRSKRPLRYIQMVYKWQGKTIAETFGWEGEVVANEEEAYSVFLELKRNRANRTPPFTLNERNVLREKELHSVEAAKLAELERLKKKELTIMDSVFALYCDAHTTKKSLQDEKSYYKNWIEPAIGKKKLDEIGLLDLERIKKKMIEAGRAPRSVQYIKSIIRQIYHYAIDRNLYTGDVPTLRFLKQPKFDNRRQRYLDPDEADKLLTEVRKHSETTYRIALLSLNSAMRFGEISRLQWQHINTDNREILIIDPKNGETRTVYMTDVILQMFKKMVRGRPDEFVFPSKQPKGENEQKQMGRISKVFAEAIDTLDLNAGITDRRMKVVFHTLRHSCASWLVNSGVELPVIAKILGHKTLTMTMRYAHVNDQSVKGAMALIDQQQAKPDKKIAPSRKQRSS